MTPVYSLRILTLVTLLGMTAQAAAEIHRWQDEQGRWHFSDSPKEKTGPGRTVFGGAPVSATNAVDDDAAATATDVVAETADDKNLKAQLERKFSTGSVIQNVTFAVVGIETALGSGSGFFVSEDGYLITNRHVVRPASSPDWEKNKTRFEQERAKLDAWRSELDQEQRSLEDYAVKLENYRRSLDKPDPAKAQNSIDWDEYRDYESRYQKRRDALAEAEVVYRNRFDTHQQQQDEFSFKSSLAGVSQSFKVFLKDNTELTASLVSISEKHDLALLKLDHFSTPRLTLVSTGTPAQGETVYAVGSPLGMRDSVTKGIVAKLEKDYVMTDAQIQPGNSGGPLVNEAGEVIGVNTMKFYAKHVLGDGFGMAIPVSVLRKEFAQWLGRDN